MSVLELKNIVKKFGNGKKDIVAVDNVDLTVKNNEFVSLVGPSGCGKSTILRMIAGLETPTSGGIYLDEKEVLGPDADRGMVFQQYTLLPWKRNNFV